jgi:hypothetical protein
VVIRPPGTSHFDWRSLVCVGGRGAGGRCGPQHPLAFPDVCSVTLDTIRTAIRVIFRSIARAASQVAGLLICNKNHVRIVPAGTDDSPDVNVYRFF